MLDQKDGTLKVKEQHNYKKVINLESSEEDQRFRTRFEIEVKKAEDDFVRKQTMMSHHDRRRNTVNKNWGNVINRLRFFKQKKIRRQAKLNNFSRRELEAWAADLIGDRYIEYRMKGTLQEEI